MSRFKWSTVRVSNLLSTCTYPWSPCGVSSKRRWIYTRATPRIHNLHLIPGLRFRLKVIWFTRHISCNLLYFSMWNRHNCSNVVYLLLLVHNWVGKRSWVCQIRKVENPFSAIHLRVSTWIISTALLRHAVINFRTGSISTSNCKLSMLTVMKPTAVHASRQLNK